MNVKRCISRVLVGLVGFGALACGASETGAPVRADAADIDVPTPLTSSEGPAEVGAPAPASRLSADRLRAYREADAVVVARLVDPRITSVLEIAPPIFVHEFSLAIDERLVGAGLPSNPRVHFSSRDHEKPFAAGVQMLVALRRVQENLPAQVSEVYEVTAIDELDPGAVAALRGPVASVDLAFTVRQIAPVKTVQWVNEYGDGLFEVVIENRGSSALTVPSMFRASDGSVDFSALVIRDDTNRALQPKGAMRSKTPLVLAPGESVKHTVDVKPFGLVQPAGGYRAYYSFQVGQLRASSFFYFTMEHHGPLMGPI